MDAVLSSGFNGVLRLKTKFLSLSIVTLTDWLLEADLQASQSVSVTLTLARPLDRSHLGLSLKVDNKSFPKSNGSGIR